MIRFVLKFCLLMGTCGFYSRAEECNKAILHEAPWAFARLILATNQPRAAKTQGLIEACSELDPTSEMSSFFRSNPSGFWDKRFNGAIGYVIMSPVIVTEQLFTNEADLGYLGMRLFGSKIEKSFAEELDRIRQIYSPAERIAQTTRLVSKYRGQYDFARADSKSTTLLYPPSKIIELAAAGKDSGVCRDYANFLVFALNNVGSVAPAFHAQSWLGKTHMWVELTAPVQRADGSVVYEKIQLDPTAYASPDYFVAFAPRENGLDTIQNHDTCIKLMSCAYDQSLNLSSR